MRCGSDIDKAATATECETYQFGYLMLALKRR